MPVWESTDTGVEHRTPFFYLSSPRSPVNLSLNRTFLGVRYKSRVMLVKQ